MRRLFSVLWFLTKLALFGTVVAWFLLNPGTISVTWHDTIIDTSLGFAAAVFALCLFVFAFAYHGWRSLLALPRRLRQQRAAAMTARGHAALHAGLLAMAAGDGRNAARHAKKATALLPGVAITHMLAAQAAQLNGLEAEADTHLALLAAHPDGAVFGLRGQMMRAIQRDDRTEATRLARAAYARDPEQPWAIDMVVQMEARQKNWAVAEKILRRAAAMKTPESARWRDDLVAALLALSDEWKHKGDLDAALDCARDALKRRPSFAPAAVRVAQLWYARGYRRRALATLREAWNTAPHPDLVRVWRTLSTTGANDDSLAARIEKLVSENPDNADAATAMAEALYASLLWGIARQHGERALALRPDRTILRLMADIERADTNDTAKIQKWLERAAEAPPAPQWVCRNTHMIFAAWQPLNHQLDFNSIVWDVPSGNASAALLPAN
jgi:HemY protein